MSEQAAAAEPTEVGSKQAHRAVKQLHVDIESGFRELLRGFQQLEYTIRSDDGWVRKLRSEPHSQARLNRAVREHHHATHLLVANCSYHPWSAEDPALLLKLYKTSDAYLRKLGLVHYKYACNFSATLPEITRIRERHIWTKVQPYLKVKNAATQCNEEVVSLSPSSGDETPVEDKPP